MGFVCLFLSGGGWEKLPGKGILCCSTILIHGLLRRVGNREVFISRVVGVPGDTLMLNDELWVTDEQV